MPKMVYLKSQIHYTFIDHIIVLVIAVKSQLSQDNICFHGLLNKSFSLQALKRTIIIILL